MIASKFFLSLLSYFQLMIQRVQTLFLLAVLLITPLIIYSIQDVFTDFFIYLIIYLISVGFLTISSILIYSKRLIQVLLNTINISINILFIGFLCYYLFIFSESFSFLSKKNIGLLIPLINSISLILANYNIKQDEKLVKSIDRIR